MRLIWLRTFCVWLFCASVCVGAPFVNLGFESVNTNTSQLELSSPLWPPQYVQGNGPVADLLPGWQLFSESFTISRIGYNYVADGVAGGGGLVGVWERSIAGRIPSIFAKLTPDSEGNYVMYFNMSEWENYALTQQGDIPKQAFILRLNGKHCNVFGSLSATINGVMIVTGPSTLFPYKDGDCSAFAGQTVELRISIDQIDQPFGGPREAYLEAIEFYPKASPFEIRLIPPEGEKPAQVRLSYTVISGSDYYVEAADKLGNENYSEPTNWETLPGGPHNSGELLVPASEGWRFYRLRTMPLQ